LRRVCTCLKPHAANVATAARIAGPSLARTILETL
jgi:hypothetical protein